MFKVSPASLQTFIDTSDSVLEDRVHYGTFHIPNVFWDGHPQIISFVGILIVRCTETFDHSVCVCVCVCVYIYIYIYIISASVV